MCNYEGCGKSFSRRAELNNHILRVHEQDKQMKCPYEGCDKTFVTNSDLRRHMEMHYPEDIQQIGGMNELGEIDMV